MLGKALLQVLLPELSMCSDGMSSLDTAPSLDHQEFSPAWSHSVTCTSAGVPAPTWKSQTPSPQAITLLDLSF